jgi:ketosteroid isomerase-like protein
MPSKTLCIVLSLALVTPFVIARVFAQPNDEAEVRKIVGGFPQSWNNHDMNAFGKLFAIDADFVNVAGNWWKGRQDIQMQHAYSHGTIPADTPGFEDVRRYYGIFKSSTMRLTQIDVRFLRRDVAVAHASCELLGDTRTPNPRYCILTFVLTREDGNWLIAAAHNTEINRTVK